MTDSSVAERLLHAAERKQREDWLAANLLTAAAMSAAMAADPIVVGGTAEAFWTGRDVYHATDLDLWISGAIDRTRTKVLQALGFRRDARHWSRLGLDVILEFTGGPFAGDFKRLEVQEVSGSRIAVIGLDDLYLDRLTRSTANSNEGSVEFLSALSVATHRFDSIDWRYVGEVIGHTRSSNPMLGDLLRQRNRRIRQLVRRALSAPAKP